MTQVVGADEARGVDALVLCYHAIDDSWPAALSTTPAAFERQLDFLLEHGYKGVTFSEAASTPAGQRTVAITFDDGFRSVLERAFPLLAERGLVASVFVPTAFIEGGRPASWEGVSQWLGTEYEPELKPLTPAELVELGRVGWEVGSHTCTHPHLTRLGNAELARELIESRRRCSELVRRSCESLAYPYGDFDERVRDAAASAGYRFACTLPKRFHHPLPLAWPRVGIWHDDSERTFALKVSPRVRRVRQSPLWGLVDRSRLALSRLRSGNPPIRGRS